MPTKIISKRDAGIDSRGILVTQVTEEILGVNSMSYVRAPKGARNVRTSLSEGRAVMTYDLQGKADEDGIIQGTLSVSATASQEPLPTHPKFRKGGDYEVQESEWKLWEKWQREGVPDELPEGLSNGFLVFIVLTQAGFTDYLQPRIVCRTVESVSGTTPNFDQLGKIASFDGAPPLPDNGDWLCTSIEAQREENEDWTVTKEFTSSGPLGWNKVIYSYA